LLSIKALSHKISIFLSSSSTVSLLAVLFAYICTICKVTAANDKPNSSKQNETKLNSEKSSTVKRHYCCCWSCSSCFCCRCTWEQWQPAFTGVEWQIGVGGVLTPRLFCHSWFYFSPSHGSHKHTWNYFLSEWKFLVSTKLAVSELQWINYFSIYAKNKIDLNFEINLICAGEIFQEKLF